MSNHSIIEHRANYHFIKIEEDYVLICSTGEQYPQCKAAILAILEHWINDKKAKGQGEYVYMTYPEWINAMYGLFRRNTIIACLAELVKENLVIRRECRRFGKDTFEYTLNVKVVQEKLKSLPERTDKNTRPNLNASKFKRVQKQTGLNLNDEEQNAVQKQTGDASKFKRNIYSSTETQEDIDSEWYRAPAKTGEDLASANAPTPAPTSSPDSYSHQPTEDTHGSSIALASTHRSDVYGARASADRSMAPAANSPVGKAGHGQPGTANAAATNRVSAGTRSQATTGQVAPAGSGGYVKPVQTTSQATTPRQSARQAPTFSNAPLFAQTKPARPTLTAEGKLVREWYQVIRSTRVRLTDDNINACNGLSEEDGISFEALKEAIEYWDEDKYVKDHEIAIDLQKLEDPKGAFTFAKAMLILRKRKKPASVTPKPEMTTIEKLRAEQMRYAQRGMQA